MIKRQIFAIGDNGFRSHPDVTALFQHLVQSTNQVRPRVCLIPTASGDDQAYMDSFDRMFSRFDCQISHLSLFRGEKEDLAEILLNQDLIYVSGGNTRNMLVLWKEWGVDVILKEAYQRGIILAGGSAGSLCWFTSGVTDSIPGRFSSMPCLGFLKESHCPHYDELTRRPYYLSAVKMRELSDGIAAENGVALHYVNEEFQEALSAYPDRNAYQVTLKHESVTETQIKARRVFVQ
jgi:peptidase E